MYSVVLMAALATSSNAPDFGNRNGCYGGCRGGSISSYSCYGAYGSGCYGSYGSGGCYGGGNGWGHGCGGGSCIGRYSGWNAYGAGCYGAYASPYATWGCYGGAGYAGYGASFVHGTCTGNYGCYGGHSCYGGTIPGTILSHPPVQAAPPAGIRPELTPPPTIEPKKGTEESRVKVRFNIPADARLFVDNIRINTNAANRVFQTPGLDPAKLYYYDLKVEIERNGETLSETQRLVIRPGQEVLASFPNLEERAAAIATAQRK